MENVLDLLGAPVPEYVEGIDFVRVTDDQLLAALMGETVTIEQPRYTYTLTFNGKSFVMEYYLGIITSDEANMCLVRLF